MNAHVFRKAQPGEETRVFSLIQERIAWMDEHGINGWNHADYTSVYPLKHYRQILQNLFVLQDTQTNEILCAGALYDADDRWEAPESAYYLHHFTSKVGSSQAGTEFLQYAENYARCQGKVYLRLDSAKNNRQLAAYYERHGYLPVGTCSDGSYQGILWEKKLDAFTVRTATTEDLDQISSVEAACFPAAEAAARVQFAARLHSYPDHFWLMFDGEKLISFVNGFATNEPNLRDEMYENAALHDPKGAWQMVFGVNTLPQYRHLGCADRLLRQAIQDAKAQGRTGLVLTCKDHMLHYYSKFGFQNEGVSENSTHGNVTWNQMRLTF